MVFLSLSTGRRCTILLAYLGISVTHCFYSRRTCTSMQRGLKSTLCSLAQWCGICHVTRPIYHVVNFKAYHVTWLTSARDWIGKEFWPFTCGKRIHVLVEGRNFTLSFSKSFNESSTIETVFHHIPDTEKS